MESERERERERQRERERERKQLDGEVKKEGKRPIVVANRHLATCT